MGLDLGTKEGRLIYRLCVASNVVNAFRSAIEANGNRYSGGLVPNITSIQEIMSCPFAEVLRSVEQFPQLTPSPEFLAYMKTVA